MSQIANILKRAMEKATGRKILRVWYEPINGPCMEMQGYAGGWMYQDETGENTLGGYSAEEAVESIIVTARLRAQDEYSQAARAKKST